MKTRSSIAFFIILPFFIQAQWQFFTKDINLEVKDVSFVSANNVFLISNNKTVNYSFLSFSNDGGATFKTIGDLKFGFHYSSLYFFDNFTGLICGYNDNNNTNYLWKTNDGGLSFRTIILDSKIGQDVPRPIQMTFVTNQIGYITTTSFSGSSFYKTMDGGETWSFLSSNDLVFINLINIMNQNTAYRFKVQNSVLFLDKSVDGLKTWQNLAIPNSSNTFSFQNESLGFIGTLTGEIYKTSDGGKNWSINTRLPNASITKLNFITPLIGYAAIKSITSKDYILRTTNGGNSWQTVCILNDFSKSIDKLFFYNENIGFAVGNSNTGIVVNATTSPTSKRPTLTLSGVDTSCNNNLDVQLKLTGTPPWKIVIQENIGINRTNFTVNTPSFEFNYLPSNPNTNLLIPVSVEDSEGFSTEVGGSSNKIPPLPTAAILKDTQKIYSLGSAINVRLKLTGCLPLSLKISENLHDTIVTGIFDPNLIYKTKINSSYLDFRITAVKSLYSSWIDLSNQGEVAPNYVRFLTNNTPTLDLESCLEFETSPNPFDDYLALKITNKNAFEGVIEIFDARGVLILNLNRRFVEGVNMLNFTTSFESGVYFLRIKSENGASKTIKLIKI